jgi:hypothetical protein
MNTRASQGRPVVVISSTLRDLPEHRKEVKEACLRQGTTPKMQEHLPASGSGAGVGAEALRVSLAMVDEAEIYLGVFAHRYGYVPEGHEVSVTEMEYDRAVERGIARLVFLMHDDHPLKASDVETGEGAQKLTRLKERLRAENVFNFFKSPEDLRAHVINSLAQYRTRHDERGASPPPQVSDIPEPPDPYIAHRHTFLQTRDLVGRGEELGLLSDWVSRPGSEVYDARVLTLVAVGGAGKSALAWKWFNDIAPGKMKPLAGRMWWNFYESDARFKNFVTRALAYVTRREREEIERSTAPAERENLLLAALDRDPFIIVLDGLDRLLNGYARGDAAPPGGDPDDDGDAECAGGAPPSEDDIRQRKTVDPRVVNFLRKLSGVRASRILVTTRTDPADLQTVAGHAMPGTFAYHMGGLNDDDALRFWQELEGTGSRGELLDFFHTFGNLPLLIIMLADRVWHHRSAPGDFDDWHLDNPTPFDSPLREVIEGLISTTLDDLDEPLKRVLHTVAAFYVHVPVPYKTLDELFVSGREAGRRHEPFTEDSLDKALTELEGRGLLGWDRAANRYSMHQIIRGTVCSGLTGDAGREIYEGLLEYFRARSGRKNCQQVKSLEDLTAETEHYNALIKLGHYEKAGRVFMTLLDKQLAYCLGYHRRRAELLRLFFPDGLSAAPRHKRKGGQTFILGAIAAAYLLCGQYRLAASLYETELERLREMETRVPRSKTHGVLTALRKMGIAVGQMGRLHGAERSFREALLEARKIKERFLVAICSQWLGILRATRGDIESARAILGRAAGILSDLRRSQSLGLVYAFLAQCELWRGDPDAAQQLIDRARQLPELKDRDLIRVRRLQGAAALARAARLAGGQRPEEAGEQLRIAEENFNFALHRARAVTHIREELQSLIGLAELEWRRNSPQASRSLLDDVTELAACGPDTLSHADALILSAQIELGEGNRAGAAAAARKAYELAWCDGPPYAYRWGLERARALLAESGGEEPRMPDFDPAKHPPLPDVDAADEFGAEGVGGPKGEG